MISFYIVKNNNKGTSIPISSLNWNGRKGAAGRSLSAILHPNYPNIENNIDVSDGVKCVVYDDKKEIFRGIVISNEMGKDKSVNITARDNLIYFANNDDTFNYINKTASEVFKDLCNRFEIAYKEVYDTGYVIPKISLEKGTLWDCMLEALQETYKATGIRYYIDSKEGLVRLLKRKNNTKVWQIAVGENLSDYSYSKSIGGIVTRLKIISSNGTVSSFEKDDELEKKVGIFQKIIKKNESLNVGLVTGETKVSLKNFSKPTEQLNITAVGNSDIVSGCIVRLKIPELKIDRDYYVDEDNHEYQGDLHTMSLTLNNVNDTEVKDVSTGSKKIGDIVDFAGGSHYISSTAETPTGSLRVAGKAKITNIAEKAPHKYHLIGGIYDVTVSGNSNVYGWVDENTVK